MVKWRVKLLLADANLFNSLARLKKQDEIALVALAHLGAATASEIKALLISHGVKAKGWNISRSLNGQPSYARKVAGGKWTLTDAGVGQSSELAGRRRSPLVGHAAQSIADELAGMDETHANFCREALSCMDAGNNRAAVVLMWAGALSMICHWIAANELAAFNSAGNAINGNGKPRYPRFKTIKRIEGFPELGDAETLSIARDAQIIDKSSFYSLKEILDR